MMEQLKWEEKWRKQKEKWEKRWKKGKWQAQG